MRVSEQVVVHLIMMCLQYKHMHYSGTIGCFPTWRTHSNLCVVNVFMYVCMKIWVKKINERNIVRTTRASIFNVVTTIRTINVMIHKISFAFWVFGDSHFHGTIFWIKGTQIHRCRFTCMPDTHGIKLIMCIGEWWRIASSTTCLTLHTSRNVVRRSASIIYLIWLHT